jgi:hypothetical protein
MTGRRLLALFSIPLAGCASVIGIRELEDDRRPPVTSVSDGQGEADSGATQESSTMPHAESPAAPERPIDASAPDVMVPPKYDVGGTWMGAFRRPGSPVGLRVDAKLVQNGNALSGTIAAACLPTTKITGTSAGDQVTLQSEAALVEISAKAENANALSGTFKLSASTDCGVFDGALQFQRQ